MNNSDQQLMPPAAATASLLCSLSVHWQSSPVCVTSTSLLYALWYLSSFAAFPPPVPAETEGYGRDKEEGMFTIIFSLWMNMKVLCTVGSVEEEIEESVSSISFPNAKEKGLISLLN